MPSPLRTGERVVPGDVPPPQWLAHAISEHLKSVPRRNVRRILLLVAALWSRGTFRCFQAFHSLTEEGDTVLSPTGCSEQPSRHGLQRAWYLGAGRDLGRMQTVPVVVAFVKPTSACVFMVSSSSKLELFSLTSH